MIAVTGACSHNRLCQTTQVFLVAYSAVYIRAVLSQLRPAQFIDFQLLKLLEPEPH
jgi:hypothetical protein